MNYRTAHILAAKGSLTSGTEVIPLNIKDVISRITIKWDVTSAGYGMNSYLHKDITKIELVDGSDVLVSLDGGQAQALALYDRKAHSINGGEFLQTMPFVSFYPIDFGRYLYDPVLALDPAKFRNLVLRVTYNYRVADTGATGGTLEVLADCFDEKPVSPVGFLTSVEHHNMTAVTGYSYVALPTDLPIRKMLVQGYAKGTAPWNVVANVKLDEDNDKRIPFDWHMYTYFAMMKGVWQPIVEPMVSVATTTELVYYGLPTDYFAQLQLSRIGTEKTVYTDTYATGGEVSVYAEEAGSTFSGLWIGWLPNHCFEFPFGDPMDLDDWYDVTRVGNLRLRLNYGGAGTYAVVIQQLRRY